MCKALKVLARRDLARDPSGHTRNATARVQEADLKLMESDTIPWRERSQFRPVASLAMRRIVVDYAR